MRHVTWTESAQVRAKHAQINLHIYGPQVAVAATTLCQEPHSKGLNICFSFRHAPVQQINHNIAHSGGKSCFPLSCFTAVAVVNPRSRNVVNPTSAPSLTKLYCDRSVPLARAWMETKCSWLKVAKDNFETFCKMWQFLLSDVIQISQQVAEQTNQLHSMALQALPPPPRIVKEPPTPTHGPPSGML